MAGRPLRAASLQGVATAYVMTAGYDPLVDEGIAYAKRLEEDGVRVTYVHMADQLHAFLTMGRFIPASDLALRHAALSLAHHWQQGTGMTSRGYARRQIGADHRRRFRHRPRRGAGLRARRRLGRRRRPHPGRREEDRRGDRGAGRPGGRHRLDVTDEAR